MTQYNYCRGCGYTTAFPGTGRILTSPLWRFWNRTFKICNDCGGNGHAKPRGPRPEPTMMPAKNICQHCGRNP